MSPTPSRPDPGGPVRASGQGLPRADGGRATGEGVPERSGADACPPAPCPVRSSPTARHGCGRRRCPPSCRDPLEPGLWGWATCPRASPAALRHLGKGQTVLGVRVGPGNWNQPEDPDAVPRPKGQDGGAAGACGVGPAGGRARAATALHRLAFRSEGPTAGLVTGGEQPTGCGSSFVSDSSRRLGPTQDPVRFQDSRPALAADVGMTATELETWMDG